METKEVIRDLREQLNVVSTTGQKAVAIEALENYLLDVEKRASESFETRKLQYQGKLAEYDAQVKSNLELFKASIEAGREALNSVILINGGAVIAVLSFLGSVVIKPTEQQLAAWLTLPLLQFGLGVFFGSAGFAARYFSQAYYGHKNKKFGDIFRIAAIIFALSGYAMFIFGVGNAYLSFKWRFML